MFVPKRLAAAVSTVALVAMVPPATGRVAKQQDGCSKHFTVQQAKRAARATYAGTKQVTRHQRRVLGWMVHCQRVRAARDYVRWYEEHQRSLWLARQIGSPQGYWLASWYYDAGSTASGFHATYGVAMCGAAGPCYPFGTRIRLYYGGRTVDAVVDDHGPYAGGRNIDLNQNVAGALGFGGVGMVGYRLL